MKKLTLASRVIRISALENASIHETNLIGDQNVKFNAVLISH